MICSGRKSLSTSPHLQEFLAYLIGTRLEVININVTSEADGKFKKFRVISEVKLTERNERTIGKMYC